MNTRIERTPEFARWLRGLRGALEVRVEQRIRNIEVHGHYGDFKSVGGKVEELRFGWGGRVYFTRVHRNGRTCLILLGGMKDGQRRDIEKAKKLREKYAPHG